ncbi:TonB-dependent receptor [Rufibacter immobilis]|uniref:TonB-dependent receptor n=1 Tax=Rufibacter immobilis TaxID=1348778 RepID=A0A3M9MXG7_9BACT|nr:TonB-dependent receptor [Rufibacter immobilis]RNI29817.1 TonB-dependent receptor [Rufibacter immobilis]
MLLLLVGGRVVGQTRINGLITNAQKESLPFARVHLVEPHIFVGANEKGEFSHTFPTDQTYTKITVVASYVGKKEQRQVVSLVKNQTASVFFILEDNNLYLNEVEVNALRQHTNNSNSSIVIGQNAIEQIQPYSLSDILLNLLPGQTILNPDLQSAKAINLRSVSTGNHALNNQFGTSIVLDGEALSNNANLQTTFSGRSETLDQLNPRGYSSGDYTFSSTDLRQIPASNIEKIEVIQGVASAKYGDMTSGAILIDRKAGMSPWSLSARFQNGTDNFSLGKGFKIGPRLGALNVSLDYLNATPSTTDKLKSYRRVSAGVLWSTHLDKARKISSNLGIDYSSSFDNWKTDPDDATRHVKTENSNVRVNYRGSWRAELPLVDVLTYSLAYSNAQQYSYESWYLNPGTKPVPVSAEVGVVEGGYSYPNYNAESSITGNPMRWSGSLGASWRLTTGAVVHTFSYGINYSYETNRGNGLDVDPYRPFRTSDSYMRDYDFYTTPALSNLGVYLEDGLSGEVMGKKWRASVGVRGDKQFHYFSLSPRVNAALELNPALSLNAAYGISTKSPGIVHVQAKPIYYDFPLINHYTNNYRENLYLLYTTKVVPDNSKLNPMRSRSIEVGLQYQQPRFQVSVTAFHRRTDKGFTPHKRVQIIDIPQYQILEARPNEQPVYEPTGASTPGYAFYSQFANALNTKDTGLEFMLSTAKVRALQTSFNFSTTLYYSNYYNSLYQVEQPTIWNYEKEALIGVYQSGFSEGLRTLSTLSTTHHISRLGLLVNLRAQFFWDEWTKANPKSVYPVAYYNADGQFITIPEAERTYDQYAHLLKEETSKTRIYQNLIYSNYHISLAKEVRRVFRLSFYANNFLNYRPEYYDAKAKERKVLNQAPSFGMEIRLTLK